MHSVWFDVVEQPKDDNLEERCMKIPPTFDCRIFNVPDMMELANCFLWRENDAIKNSISGMALSFFSHKQLQGMNSEEKIAMMAEKGYDFYKDTPESFRRGTFYQRRKYTKVISASELDKMPMKQKENLSFCPETNEWYCTRARVTWIDIPYRLTHIANKVEVLFEEATAISNRVNSNPFQKEEI